MLPGCFVATVHDLSLIVERATEAAVFVAAFRTSVVEPVRQFEGFSVCTITLLGLVDVTYELLYYFVGDSIDYSPSSAVAKAIRTEAFHLISHAFECVHDLSPA